MVKPEGGGKTLGTLLKMIDVNFPSRDTDQEFTATEETSKKPNTGWSGLV
jgi:hypothetical protein